MEKRNLKNHNSSKMKYKESELFIIKRAAQHECQMGHTAAAHNYTVKMMYWRSYGKQNISYIRYYEVHIIIGQESDKKFSQTGIVIQTALSDDDYTFPDAA